VRRRRSGWVALFVTIVVIIAIALVADRVAQYYATQRLRDQIVSELDSRGIGHDTLAVNVGGFPFLTQVVRGRYDAISIDLTGVTLPPGPGTPAVAIPQLHAVATDVMADAARLLRGNATVTASRVTGTALISFSTLEALVDQSPYGLSNFHVSADGTAVRATGTVSLGSAGIPVSATADVTVSGGEFEVRLRNVSAVGVATPGIVAPYLQALTGQAISGRFPALPFGLNIDTVSVQPDGLSVGASGRDVSLSS
jgi:hypothetical protein